MRANLPDITNRKQLKLLSPEDEELETDLVAPATVFAKENWLALCDLIGTDGTVHLSGVSDAENGDVRYASVYLHAEGKPRRACGGTVEAVVSELAGGLRKKVCARCLENKPLDA